jgi:hypothetical protein
MICSTSTGFAAPGQQSAEQDSFTLEIDRGWDWAELSIERDGQALPSRKLAVVTGDWMKA